jgi:hypothetical protein
MGNQGDNVGNAEDVAVERDRQIAYLEAEVARLRVSRETGVPVGLLANGQTAEEIDRIASDALCWRGELAPSRPATAAVPASTVTSGGRIEMPHQVATQDELRRLSPAERMRAYREGRLIQLGAGPPQPRQIGLSGAPTTRT